MLQVRQGEQLDGGEGVKLRGGEQAAGGQQARHRGWIMISPLIMMISPL